MLLTSFWLLCMLKSVVDSQEEPLENVTREVTPRNEDPPAEIYFGIDNGIISRKMNRKIASKGDAPCPSPSGVKNFEKRTGNLRTPKKIRRAGFLALAHCDDPFR